MLYIKQSELERKNALFYLPSGPSGSPSSSWRGRHRCRQPSEECGCQRGTRRAVVPTPRGEPSSSLSPLLLSSLSPLLLHSPRFLLEPPRRQPPSRRTPGREDEEGLLRRSLPPRLRPFVRMREMEGDEGAQKRAMERAKKKRNEKQTNKQKVSPSPIKKSLHSLSKKRKKKRSRRREFSSSFFLSFFPFFLVKLSRGSLCTMAQPSLSSPSHMRSAARVLATKASAVAPAAAPAAPPQHQQRRQRQSSIALLATSSPFSTPASPRLGSTLIPAWSRGSSLCASGGDGASDGGRDDPATPIPSSSIPSTTTTPLSSSTSPSSISSASPSSSSSPPGAALAAAAATLGVVLFAATRLSTGEMIDNKREKASKKTTSRTTRSNG